MRLTRKQKNNILKLQNLTGEEIAKKLNLDQKTVSDFLNQRTGPPTGGNQSPILLKLPTDSTNKGIGQLVADFFRNNKIKIGLIVLLGFLVYSTSLPNGFVSDDLPLVISPYLKNPFYNLENEWVNALINSATYTLNYFVGGTRPFGYHLVNVLLHLFFSVFLFFFLSLLTPNRLAFLASLIFTVHPIHTEAVSWVSGRHYILYSVFILAALFFYIRSTNPAQKSKTVSYLSSLLAYVLAIYSFPEQAIIFPLLLPLIDLAFGRVRKRLKLYLPFFVTAAFFTFISLERISYRVASLAADPQGLERPAASFLTADVVALFNYLKLFLFPLGLSFYHEDLSLPSWQLALMVVVVLGIFLVLPIFLFKRQRLLLFFLLFFPITLLPTLTPLKISWVVAERYVYLGSVGLSVLTAYLLDAGLRKKKLRKICLYLAFVVVAAFSYLTFRRGFDWKDEDSLWLATVKASPGSSKAWNNMGDYYGRHGDLKASFEAFVKATQINPSYADAWHNAGNTLMQTGKLDEAIPYFEKSLEFNPNLTQAYDNLAVIAYRKGDVEKARELMGKSLQINPRSIKTYHNLALIEYKSGNREAAIEALTKALAIDPTNEELKQNLLFLRANEKK